MKTYVFEAKEEIRFNTDKKEIEVTLPYYFKENISDNLGIKDKDITLYGKITKRVCFQIKIIKSLQKTENFFCEEPKFQLSIEYNPPSYYSKFFNEKFSSNIAEYETAKFEMLKQASKHPDTLKFSILKT